MKLGWLTSLPREIISQILISSNDLLTAIKVEILFTPLIRRRPDHSKAFVAFSIKTWFPASIHIADSNDIAELLTEDFFRSLLGVSWILARMPDAWNPDLTKMAVTFGSDRVAQMLQKFHPSIFNHSWVPETVIQSNQPALLAFFLSTPNLNRKFTPFDLLRHASEDMFMDSFDLFDWDATHLGPAVETNNLRVFKKVHEKVMATDQVFWSDLAKSMETHALFCAVKVGSVDIVEFLCGRIEGSWAFWDRVEIEARKGKKEVLEVVLVRVEKANKDFLEGRGKGRDDERREREKEKREKEKREKQRMEKEKREKEEMERVMNDRKRLGCLYVFHWYWKNCDWW
ncbi:hypothetical protein HDU97_006743 [Phlyctochytrium planicorne]|nr:hypothetical protein HDU97_006743 [Phlyctochytrium planicorne]